MSKAWTEIAIKRKRYSGKRETHTIPSTGGLSFSVREDGTYYEWRMMRSGKNFKVHIGSALDIPLNDAKEQARKYRQNVKLGLPPHHSLSSGVELRFQDAYDYYIDSKEFASLKPGYQETFKFRMEKYVVDSQQKTAKKIELRKKQITLKNSKLSDTLISSIKEVFARQLWSKIKDHESANVAKAIKSHCKVVIDWNMQNKGLTLSTNPFDFSVPRTTKTPSNSHFTDDKLRDLIAEIHLQ